MMKTEESKRMFSNVLWLAGASDAGKTTIANMLAHKHRWQLYPCDFHEFNHFIARADPKLQPLMYSGYGKSVDESWVHTTPEDLFENVIDTNDERFPMICDDLRSMPAHPVILVEGPRLFPKLVLPLLTDIHQAIWLLPTEEFALKSANSRGKPRGRLVSSDPDRFQHNFLRREALLREYIRSEVIARGLPHIVVDGSNSVDEVANQVENHFLDYLCSGKRANE